MAPDCSRRDFLRLSAGGATGAALMLFMDPVYLQAASPMAIGSPLAGYPSRDWEKVYRDIWTDLPPGHPLVTGYQTVEFDLWAVEHAKLVVTWGMNWIATKMPDAHWLTESRLKGTKVINISTDYQATSHKADEVLVIRPGTDAALMLGACKVILDENLYDADHVRNFTDLPFLIRMDTLKHLRASDVIPGYRPAPLTNGTRVYATDAKGNPTVSGQTGCGPAWR